MTARTSARIRFSQHALLRMWALSALGAIVLVIILECMDSALLQASGLGIFALDKASAAYDVRFILDRWQLAPQAGLAGAILGLSFLLIPLYGTALWLGGIKARDLYAPNPGRLRRYMNALALAPLIGGLCDIIAKTLQLQMLITGPDLITPPVAYELVILKWAGVAIGILLSLIAVLKALLKRRKKA